MNVLIDVLKLVVYVLIDLFAILSTVFSCFVLSKIYKKKGSNGVKKNLIFIFGLFSVGLIFSTLGELSWDFAEFILNVQIYYGFPDFFWMIGLFFIFLGFLGFYLKNSDNKSKSGLVIFSTVVVLFILSILLINYPKDYNLFELFLYFYYPIITSLTIVFTFPVYLSFRKEKVFGKSLLLFAFAHLSNFIAESIYTFYGWIETYGYINLTYDFFYFMFYFLSSLSLYILIKNWVKKK